jgi:hypothetical protein
MSVSPVSAASVSFTVDVEDWYEGIAVLGHPVPAPARLRSGLEGMASLVDRVHPSARLTLFVVGRYAGTVARELADLASAGHEIASHGADHGRLPTDAAALEHWLRRGREQVEDLLGVAVTGFRSPRFDRPADMSLLNYRECLAKAGFTYVSDTASATPDSPVKEIPVLNGGRLHAGGGSYQRLLPMQVIRRQLLAPDGPSVVYYHSYDFGATLPSVWRHPSPAVAAQVLGRSRIPTIFGRLLSQYGSTTCSRLAEI